MDGTAARPAGISHTGAETDGSGPAGALPDIIPLARAAAHGGRDAALLAAHAAGAIGDRLVLHRFRPAVLIGRHQTAEHEARIAFCASQGIDVARRMTGGGALYLDPGQLAASLIVPAAALGRTTTERLLSGAGILAGMLAQLGVAATIKPPNDLQIANRQKIASVFLHQQGASALLFFTLILRLDLARAMQALLVPTEKLTQTGLEHARERMTSLVDVTGSMPDDATLARALRGACDARLGTRFSHPAPRPAGEPAAAAALPLPQAWPATGATFETRDKVPGAVLRLWLRIDQRPDAQDVAQTVRFATDGHLLPADGLERLAAHLAGRPVAGLAAAASDWLADAALDCDGFSADDLVRLVARAASKWRMQGELGLTPSQTSGLMLAGGDGDPSAALARANVMLVPYCAKPNWCKWRHTVDCVECGACEVGDAYLMARERNMEVVTITNFEHLATTLADMKTQGVESYVGMCCGEFFLKRHHAFRDSGMEAVLLDIEGATCYELKEEDLAYAGQFSAEAALDIDAVAKVMAKVPVQEPARRPCLTGAAPRTGERHHALVAGGGCKSCSCRTKPPPGQ